MNYSFNYHVIQLLLLLFLHWVATIQFPSDIQTWFLRINSTRMADCDYLNLARPFFFSSYAAGSHLSVELITGKQHFHWQTRSLFQARMHRHGTNQETMLIVSRPCKPAAKEKSRFYQDDLWKWAYHIQTNLLFPPHYIKNTNCFTTSSKLPLESLCSKPQNSKNPCGSMFLNVCRLYSLQNGTKIGRLEKKNIGYFL